MRILLGFKCNELHMNNKVLVLIGIVVIAILGFIVLKGDETVDMTTDVTPEDVEVVATSTDDTEVMGDEATTTEDVMEVATTTDSDVDEVADDMEAATTTDEDIEEMI